MRILFERRAIPVWVIIVCALAAVAYLSLDRIDSKRVFSSRHLIRIGYNATSVNHGPIMVALEKGFFEESGIEIKAFSFRGGRDVTQALAAGQIDIGTGALSGFLVPIAARIPVKIIAMCTSGQTTVYVHPDSGIETVSDLEGKAIGMGRTTGSAGLSFQAVLKRHGLSLNKDMEFRAVAREHAPIALMEHKILDAFVTSAFFDVKFEEVGAVMLPEWKSKGYDEQLWPRTSVAIRADVLKERTPEVRKFLEGYIASHRFISRYPDEAAAIMARHITDRTDGVIEFSTEEVKAARKTLRYHFSYEPDVIIDLAATCREIGMIERELSLQEIIDARFDDLLTPSD